LQNLCEPSGKKKAKGPSRKIWTSFPFAFLRKTFVTLVVKKSQRSKSEDLPTAGRPKPDFPLRSSAKPLWTWWLKKTKGPSRKIDLPYADLNQISLCVPLHNLCDLSG
jgi:hypothetical protein